jgi:hypothetical protein
MERWSLATGAAIGQVTRTVPAIAEARKTRALVAAIVLCLDQPPGLRVEGRSLKSVGVKGEGRSGKVKSC